MWVLPLALFAAGVQHHGLRCHPRLLPQLVRGFKFLLNLGGFGIVKFCLRCTDVGKAFGRYAPNGQDCLVNAVPNPRCQPSLEFQLLEALHLQQAVATVSLQE